MIDRQWQLIEALKNAVYESAELRQKLMRVARDLADTQEEFANLHMREHMDERLVVVFEDEIGEKVKSLQRSALPFDADAEILGPFLSVRFKAGKTVPPKIVGKRNEVLAEFDRAQGQWTSPLIPARAFRGVRVDGRFMWAEDLELP